MAQYDLKKLAADQKIKLEWHGEPTMVLLDGEAKKREVGTGDVIEVTVDQARRLLRYSHKWTLEGDKPVEHGWEKAQAAALKGKTLQPVAKKAKASNGGEPEQVTLENVGSIKKKATLQDELKKRGKSFNAKATLEDLRGLLVEALEEEAGNTGSDETDETGDQDGENEGSEE